MRLDTPVAMRPSHRALLRRWFDSARQSEEDRSAARYLGGAFMKPARGLHEGAPPSAQARASAPAIPAAHPLLELQRAVGNRTFGRVVAVQRAQGRRLQRAASMRQMVKAGGFEEARGLFGGRAAIRLPDRWVEAQLHPTGGGMGYRLTT